MISSAKHPLFKHPLLERSLSWILFATLVAIGIYVLLAAIVNNFTLLQPLLLSSCVLALLRWYLSADNSPIVAGVFAWYLNCLVAYVIWRDGGVENSVVFAFIAAVTVPILYGRKGVLLSILFFSVCYLYLLNLIAQLGYTSHPVNWNKTHVLCLCLLAYAYVFNKLLVLYNGFVRRLQKKNKRLSRQLKRLTHEKKQNLFTKLGNDLACEEHFRRFFGRIGQTPALLCIKINNYDDIVATQGETVAVEFILKLSKEIQTHTEYCAFHTSKKELTVVVTLTESEILEAELLAIKRIISQTFEMHSGQISLKFQAGVSQYPFDGGTYKEIRKKAVIAMNTEEARQNFASFRADMEAKLVDTIRISEALKQAISKVAFELYYQPKVDLQSEQIVGYEALIRWQHEGNFVSPEYFIGVAEANGLISDIGAWVIEQACEDCQRWNKTLSKALPVAVNVSPQQFKQGDLARIISSSLHKNRLSPSLLELELTESIEFDDKYNVEQQIDVIKSLGVILSIDDFGSGYSNLAYISRFQAETLKIDKSFIFDITTNRQNLHIVEAIIQIAKAFGIKVVAEGVEDAQTATLLINSGVDMGQGYYWAKPMPMSQLLDLSLP
ncbi:bifunctional diguanylate cyclase/phosphodiesterase [Agaribacter flavus]|uniref:EAL domain-containing protein n=1 Tax=Agaribacter flavus TaxID=1902781 RepID=A0ABV7FSL0_9ALTE